MNKNEGLIRIMSSARILLLGAGLFLTGCIHPFKQRFSTSHDVNFSEVDGFAALSEAVYESDSVIQAVCAGQGYSSVVVKSFPDRETRYFLATDTTTHRHLISVQGTANLKNALLDIEYDKTKDPLIEIPLHRGFHVAAQGLYNDAILRMNKEYSISLTGHSLEERKPWFWDVFENSRLAGVSGRDLWSTESDRRRRR
ncbi:MAG: hypothetical protein IPP35_12585 [Elusimicrobia bacterium]|nr:hypothetical protein [Elusimicrobiota bacterium]